MAIKYTNKVIPNINEAINIFCELGWGNEKNYDLERWEKTFSNSKFVSAYNNDELIGFVRYITDGFHETYASEFVIKPEFQKNGVGKTLLETFIKLNEKTDIYLNTTKETKDFFTNNGMKLNKLIGVSKGKIK